MLFVGRVGKFKGKGARCVGMGVGSVSKGNVGSVWMGGFWKVGLERPLEDVWLVMRTVIVKLVNSLLSNAKHVCKDTRRKESNASALGD